MNTVKLTKEELEVAICGNAESAQVILDFMYEESGIPVDLYRKLNLMLFYNDYLHELKAKHIIGKLKVVPFQEFEKVFTDENLAKYEEMMQKQ